jgi:hypothetical protein
MVFELLGRHSNLGKDGINIRNPLKEKKISLVFSNSNRIKLEEATR